MYINPIDKDKVADNPGLLEYPHTIGSLMVRPEEKGKIKSRALSAMEEQTGMQLKQIQQQVEILMEQAREIQERKQVSGKIYQADCSFEPFIGHVYYLYEKEERYKLMMIAPEEWGRSKPESLIFISKVKLLSDHTWEILNSSPDQ